MGEMTAPKGQPRRKSADVVLLAEISRAERFDEEATRIERLAMQVASPAEMYMLQSIYTRLSPTHRRSWLDFGLALSKGRAANV